MKKAEDSNHAVLRIYESEGRETTVQIGWMNEYKGMIPLNMIEEENNGAVHKNNKVNVSRHSIETFKLVN